MKIIKIIEVEAIVGGDIYEIILECRRMAQLEHVIVKVELNGVRLSIDEFQPLWSIMRNYEEASKK